MKKLGLFFGGVSTEHSISILSAQNIYQSIKDIYDVHLFVVDKNFKIRLVDEFPEEEEIEFIDDEPNLPSPELEIMQEMDYIFSVVHGKNGEDGTMQGLFNSLGLNSIYESIVAQAISSDKDLAKRIARSIGIETLEGNVLYSQEDMEQDYLNFPVFIKPANSGSCIGISKVKRAKDVKLALEEAFLNDSKVLLEKYKSVRELACAYFCGEISEIVEVIPSNEYFDYESKYFSDNTTISIPAQVGEDIKEKVSNYTRDLAKAIGLK